jgi:hypothetical protein
MPPASAGSPPAPAAPKHARPRRRSRAPLVIFCAAALIIILAAGLTLRALKQGWIGSKANLQLGAHQSNAEGAAPTSDWGLAPTPEEARQLEAIAAGANPNSPDLLYLPTPLVATYEGLVIHTPVCVTHITEVEYHQASYDWALPLNPLLTIVDAEAVIKAHGTRHVPAREQPTGEEAMLGEAVSTWRLDSAGPEFSALDVGALAGTTVYAPVTGTVVRIKSYRLFDVIDDYELHIQVAGHPEWDIVVLHIDQLLVKEGETIVGGVTPIAQVRDIGEFIDNNLSNFTPLDDPGNHAHVQVNNALAEGYRGLEGALDIFAGSRRP